MFKLYFQIKMKTDIGPSYHIYLNLIIVPRTPDWGFGKPTALFIENVQIVL